jgi:hypothetical protein
VVAVAPAPRLHPNLAEVYRQRVATLSATLARDDAKDARDVIWGLVEAITLVPEDGRLRIEVRAELDAILRLAEGARSGVADAFCVPVAMVAGARNRRSHRSIVAVWP